MDRNVLFALIENVAKRFMNNYEIEVTGTSGAADGYLGDIQFVKVKNTAPGTGRKKVLYLVAKSGKTSEIVRKTIPIRQFFEQEIVIYTKIFPSFEEIHRRKQVKERFISIPKCYEGVLLENREVIIFRNLQSEGFKMHDRKEALNSNHLKLVLQEYGKLHALSLAMHNQQKQQFEKMCSDLNDLTVQSLSYCENDDSMLYIMLNNAKDIMREKNEIELSEKVQTLVHKHLIADLLKLLEDKTSLSLIAHMDAWNNNYLFRYDLDHDSPYDVAIIDWQMSTVRNSPVYDLSHFLYTCSSPEDLDKLDELLLIYHKSFSKSLTQLGSDPGNIFPFSMLVDHWKKFSVFGLMYVPYVLKQCFWDGDDIPVLDDNSANSDWGNTAANVNIQDDRFYDRLIGVFKHYFEYNLSDKL